MYCWQPTLALLAVVSRLRIGVPSRGFPLRWKFQGFRGKWDNVDVRVKTLNRVNANSWLHSTWLMRCDQNTQSVLCMFCIRPTIWYTLFRKRWFIWFLVITSANIHRFLESPLTDLQGNSYAAMMETSTYVATLPCQIWKFKVAVCRKFLPQILISCNKNFSKCAFVNRVLK